MPILCAYRKFEKEMNVRRIGMGVNENFCGGSALHTDLKRNIALQP
jgi:hypothetical protein